MTARQRLSLSLALALAASALVSTAALAQSGSLTGSTPVATSTSPSNAPTGTGIPISGRLFTDVYAPVRDLDTAGFRQVSASAWLESDPRLGEFGSAHFILQADQIEASATYPPGMLFKLREGYAQWNKGSLDLRFGRQIIPWGKSDVINPTDFLSAKDYTFFNPDDEVRRLGATSLSATWAPKQGMSPWSLTAVWQPVAPESVLLIAPFEVPPNARLTGVSPPAATFGNSEAAFKIAYNGGNWDASLLAFRGLSHMPEFSLTNVSGTPPALTASVAQVFHRIRALGGDASLTTGSYVFRLESAYVWTENNDGLNPTVQPSHWDSVLGVERPIGEDFRVQAQVLYRYFPDWSDPATPLGADPVSLAQAQVAQVNALILGYQDKSRPGFTLRGSYTNDEIGIEAEIFLMGNFVGGDYLARPKLSYAITDALKGTLGLDWYAGPVNRPLGTLAAYNAAFMEAKYSF